LAAGVAGADRLLLVDEPTSQLDPAGRDSVIDGMHALHDALRATIVMVTHDPAVCQQASVPRTRETGTAGSARGTARNPVRRPSAATG